MTYFSLLYETKSRETIIKANSKLQLFRKTNTESERKFEFIGSKMVQITNSNLVEHKYPGYFIDLDLDQVVNAILPEETDDLNDMFYELLPEMTDILYRQNIFKDLDHPKIYDSILEFKIAINQLYRLLDYEKQANHPLQSNKYHLDAIVLYQSSILKLLAQISDLVASPGFRSLIVLLKNHTDTYEFQEQHQIASSLVQRVEEISYTMTMQQNKVLIDFKKGENDYYDTLIPAFRTQEKNRSQISFFKQVTLSHFELKLADIIYAKEKSLFKECSDFVKATPEFILSYLPRIYNELSFYMNCHDYIESIKLKSFPVSYPELITNQNIEIKHCYDINLAKRALKETDVITNDFNLNQSESGAWVTGANQGGKTTFARSIGQLVYFTLIGMPVPAQYARLPLFQGIFTHFTCEENSFTDNGKLKEELIKISDLLEHSKDKRCLFLLNELFSSTTTADAYDLCVQLTNKIVKQNAVVLCVTHIPRLADAVEGMISLGTELVDNVQHERTYKIVPKAAGSTSYALDIAHKYQLSFEEIKERLNDEN